jgi:hypothetical protein
MQRWRIYGGIIASIVVLPVAVWACPVCLGGDEGLIYSMRVSILFLLSVPFLIAGSIAMVFFVAYKRAQGKRPWQHTAP